MSAGTIEAPARSTSKKKQKSQHWFRLAELEVAREHEGGLMLIAYCGRLVRCGRAAPPVIVPIVGELMAASGPRDCKTCVRAYEAQLARVVRRRDRWNEINGR